MPHLQCCKPMNCCFILRPQRGQCLLFLPIQSVENFLHCQDFGEKFFNGGIQLGFLCFQGGFCFCVGFFGFQFGDGFFGRFQRGAVCFELPFQTADLLEDVRDILLELLFFGGLFSDGRGEIHSSIGLIGLGFVFASFGSGHDT